MDYENFGLHESCMQCCDKVAYNVETLPQKDDLRRATIESAHIVQSDYPIAR